MQHENTSLRATISRQSQKIGRIENELRKNELLLKDQGELHNTVEKQKEKIIQYQREIEETKLHMARLEGLVHQVQEQSMKEHVTATPSVSISERFIVNLYRNNASIAWTRQVFARSDNLTEDLLLRFVILVEVESFQIYQTCSKRPAFFPVSHFVCSSCFFIWHGQYFPWNFFRNFCNPFPLRRACLVSIQIHKTDRFLS